MHKTLEEMQELAVKTFGDGATVSYESGIGWVIHTEIEESPFSWDGLEDTPAYKASHTGDGGETTLERWGRKNGHGWGSMGELVSAYNEMASRPVSDHGDPEIAKRYLTKHGVSFKGMSDKEIWDRACEELDNHKGLA